MKKIILQISLLVSATFMLPQASISQCENGRYASNVFSDVTVANDVIYGSNNNYAGSSVSLKVDIYQPLGDTLEARPLIIWAHGGSFIGGNENLQDMTDLSTEFAKKGFVCASMSYRLGFFPIDSANAVKAVIRAMQDMKGCIRFFRKDFETGNIYKIDTSQIFIGGTSAGAITALHTAYLTDPCEITPYIGSTTFNNLGGLEGNSGNAGYSTKVKGVINLCGALAKYHWLRADDVPVVSLHGTADGTVKYSRGVVNPGVPLLFLDGSRMIHERANAIGVENSFYTFRGADHTPFIGTSPTAVAYMDTTFKVVRDFLIDQMGCTEPPLQLTNTPSGTANLYAFTDCTASSSELGESLSIEMTIYPNPNNGKMIIQFQENVSEFNYRMVDMSGKIIDTGSYLGNSLNLSRSLENGNYLFYFETSNGVKGVSRFVVSN
jgi:poly(3-hydroxybutyrate) depolymerase